MRGVAERELPPSSSEKVPGKAARANRVARPELLAVISNRARLIVDYFANGCGACSLGAGPCTQDDAACADRDAQERFVQSMLDVERGAAIRAERWEPPSHVTHWRDCPACVRIADNLHATQGRCLDCTNAISIKLGDLGEF